MQVKENSYYGILTLFMTVLTDIRARNIVKPKLELFRGRYTQFLKLFISL